MMNSDLVLHGHHFQQIQNYPFVHGDCLFDSLTFFFVIPKLHFNSQLNA
jgi:hypothetical protein